MSNNLIAKKALIFRITHVSNLPWILENGLHCANAHQDAGFVPIGDPDIIARRQTMTVPAPPGGSLSDYVPFYFTPHTPMLYNIRTGHRGITRRDNKEIVILVSSLHKVREYDGAFVFTDRHVAAAAMARFSSNLADLEDFVPWDLLRARDFRRDPEWPDKLERYQAEALVYRHLPVEALLGIVCYSDEVAEELTRHVTEQRLHTEVHVRPGWYFP